MMSDPILDKMKIVGKFRVTAPASPAMPATGYQMRVNLSRLNKNHSIASNIPQLNVGFGLLQSNFNDVVFIMEGGKVLPHQVIIHADKSNAALPECWVKIPFMPASSSRIVHVLAGDAVVNRNNGDQCFELWDHFEGASISPRKWGNWTGTGRSTVISNSIVTKGITATKPLQNVLSSIQSFGTETAMRCRISTGVVNLSQNTNSEIIWPWYFIDPYDCFNTFCFSRESLPQLNYSIGSAGSGGLGNITPLTGLAINTFYIIEGRRINTSQSWYVNDLPKGSVTTTITNAGLLQFNIFNAANEVDHSQSIDWVHVRNCIATEPTITLL